MDFVNELRKRGKRITNAREVVCKILETSGHKHFTVEELHKFSLKKDKNIDLATVYRTLELLENIKTLASESYSTVNSPAQFAAVEAYNGDFREYKSKTTNILKSVGNYVYSHLKSNKVLLNPTFCSPQIHGESCAEGQRSC